MSSPSRILKSAQKRAGSPLPLKIFARICADPRTVIVEPLKQAAKLWLARKGSK